jgi:hypothetical protein
MAEHVTISVYSHVFLEKRRRKYLHLLSVQSIIGATHSRRAGSSRGALPRGWLVSTIAAARARSAARSAALLSAMTSGRLRKQLIRVAVARPRSRCRSRDERHAQQPKQHPRACVHRVQAGASASAALLKAMMSPIAAARCTMLHVR